LISVLPRHTTLGLLLGAVGRVVDCECLRLALPLVDYSTALETVLQPWLCREH
jgi:hypothetical protein